MPITKPPIYSIPDILPSPNIICCLKGQPSAIVEKKAMPKAPNIIIGISSGGSTLIPSDNNGNPGKSPPTKLKIEKPSIPPMIIPISPLNR